MNDVLLHIAFILVLLVVVLTVAGLLTWIELRVLALVQDRYGPKEDWIPPFADRPLFVLAPTIIITTVLVSLAVVPFSPGLVVQPMNVGLLF